MDNTTTQRVPNESYNWFMDDPPSFWVGTGSLSDYRSLPIQPEYGWRMSFRAHVAQRRLIVSSPLLDSITGSDPTYNTTIFFPSSVIRREPLTGAGSNATIHASGLIHLPEYIETSDRRQIVQFEDSAPMCEVTEDYRTTSTFDLFASIGGLLALLQGIHLFLFGRPLFWGMFGTKLVTPFGLVSQLATNGFKQRLKERYHRPTKLNALESQQSSSTSRSHTAADMNVAQFLLDFVVDMGPASSPITVVPAEADYPTNANPTTKCGQTGQR